MAVSSQDVVNEALALIGYDGNPVSAPAPNFDSSTPGQIAQRTYPYAVAAVGRLTAWSFPRTVNPLVATGNAAPFPWAYEYGYPARCIDIWQLAPTTLADLNNPVPEKWARGVAMVSGVQSSVLWVNLSPALAIFNGNPIESVWDALFREQVVMYLAGRFGIASLGKPDIAELYVEQWRMMFPAAAERTDQ